MTVPENWDADSAFMTMQKNEVSEIISIKSVEVETLQIMIVKDLFKVV